jgi:CRP/FNR family cyclic AMP-dependent transcriptional regulator
MSSEIFWSNIFKIERKKDSLYSFLKNNRLFEGFSSRDLKQVEKLVHVRKFKKNEIIFKESEPGTGMYIIKNGKVRIVKHKLNEDASSSNEELVTVLKKHDFFGELSLIEKTRFPRNASAYADGESELIGFFKPDIFEVVERNPKLGIKIIMRISEIIAARLRTTTSLISEKKEEIERLKSKLPEPQETPSQV